jgi:hypothetical protein
MADNLKRLLNQGVGMTDLKTIPQEALTACLQELQDEFDVRLERWTVSRFTQRVMCGDFELALMAVRVKDHRVVLNYVRIPYERAEGTLGSSLEIWTLIQGRLIVGIGELNEFAEDDKAFPHPARIWQRPSIIKDLDEIDAITAEGEGA